MCSIQFSDVLGTVLLASYWRWLIVNLALLSIIEEVFILILFILIIIIIIIVSLIILRKKSIQNARI